MPPGAPVPEVRPDPTGRRRRAIVAWCLFDFANSSYTTLIVTVAFSIYFCQVAVGGPAHECDRLWGGANSLAMLVVALLAPVAGAIADLSGRKKGFLIGTTLLTVGATALLATVGPGALGRAALLYIVATIGFEAGYVFYNAFLPELARSDNIGAISGWAWAVGFLGGLASLALCAPLLASDLADASDRLIPGALHAWQTSFVLVALFYLVFALPAFIWLPRAPAQTRARTPWVYVRAGFARVLDTLGHLRTHRETGKFVLASLFFNDGITTVIVFSANFAAFSFGFDSADRLRLFVVLNVVAFPGALVAGYLADRIGAKRTLILSLGLWIGVVLTGASATSRTAFWLMAAGAAVGMGSTQAVARSMMAQLSPPHLMSEFFGFYVLSGKFAAISGPALFGWVSAATGSQRFAVLSLLPLFLIGLALLVWVDVARATAQGSTAAP